MFSLVFLQMHSNEFMSNFNVGFDKKNVFIYLKFFKSKLTVIECVQFVVIVQHGGGSGLGAEMAAFNFHW